MDEQSTSSMVSKAKVCHEISRDHLEALVASGLTLFSLSSFPISSAIAIAASFTCRTSFSSTFSLGGTPTAGRCYPGNRIGACGSELFTGSRRPVRSSTIYALLLIALGLAHGAQGLRLTLCRDV